jgi:NDP-mannose synthase
LNYSELFDTHANGKHLFTISSHRREHKVDYGVLETRNGNLVGFQEKPLSHFEVSMGVYMVSREVVEWVPQDRPYGFDDLMRDLLAADRPVQVRPFAGYWLDIGRADDYMRAIDEFASLRHRFIDG